MNKVNPKISYTVAEAAKFLGVTPTTVYRWLNSRLGRLERARVVGDITLVTGESVERALKEADRG